MITDEVTITGEFQYIVVSKHTCIFLVKYFLLFLVMLGHCGKRGGRVFYSQPRVGNNAL